MKRVMIVGGSGAGKSTLARALGAATGLPVHHMDHIHWKAGWVPRPRAERKDMAMAVEAGETWIFEGGFSTTYENRARRADTLIWLDLPVALRLWRVTRRMFQYYGQRRPDLPEGCNEVFGGHTVELYRWIWRSRETGRTRIRTLIAAHRHLEVHHVRDKAMLARLMRVWGCS